MQSLSLSILDGSLIGVYFLLVFGLSYFATKKEKKGGKEDSQDYFLAGRDLGWFLVGSSIFASNIGSEHLVGLAGSGASTGVVVAQFEILACFILLLLGWFFVPFYLRNSVKTMPEFLEQRFSKSARNYLTFISIVSYIITKISVTIYAGAVIFEAIGVDFWVGATVVVLVTGVYTVLGGLRAVIYTDALQMFVMLGGAIFVTYFGLQAVGGMSELRASLPPEFFNMWRPASHPDFPWTGILFGAPILGVWYWCTDQFVVQRALSARNVDQARKGTLFAGYLKLLPLFIFVFPGMICLALSNQGSLVLDKPDHALAALANFVLPTGFKGIVIAGLLAALMSSLSSVFNSCSTLVTYEVFKKWKPQASENQLVFVGRISTAILVLLGVAWIPMMDLVSGELFTYIQSVQAYISPPIASIFLLGLMWKRLNSKGAMTALYTGFVLGIGRLMLEIFKGSEPEFLTWFVQMNFLHFAIFLFVLTSVLLIVVSLLTDENKINQESAASFFKAKEITASAMETRSRPLSIALSIGLVVLVLYVWWVYS